MAKESPTGEQNSVKIALISAAGLVVVALIGLVPLLVNGKDDNGTLKPQEPPGRSVDVRGTVEDSAVVLGDNRIQQPHNHEAAR